MKGTILLLEFSTKKYVLDVFYELVSNYMVFLTYFMASFRSEKQPYIWVPFYHRVFIYSYATANVQLFHSLTGPRSPARAVSGGATARVRDRSRAGPGSAHHSPARRRPLASRQDVSLAGWERGACLRPICNFVMRTSAHRICRMRVGLAVAWVRDGR